MELKTEKEKKEIAMVINSSIGNRKNRENKTAENKTTEQSFF